MLQSVRENNFTSNRDLGGYAQVLGPGFLGHLHGLQAGDHWVDAGAGDCAAVAEYLGTQAHCRVSAIGIHPPANRPACDLHLGRTLEDLPVEEVAPADLITDVYGPLQYSLKLDEVVRWYLRVLKPGGLLWMATPVTTFVESGGREYTFPEWLGRQTGLEHLREPHSGHLSRVYRRTSSDVAVPALQQVRAFDGPPPYRVFRELDGPR